MYRILLSNISSCGPKSVPLPKPNFIHGNRIDASINYISDFVIFKYVNEAGNKVTLSSQGLYQRTTSIRSKMSTIPLHREMNLSWVVGKPRRPDFCKASAPFYNIWNDARSIDILELGFSWKILASMRASQMRPVGLGVLEDDGCGWVGKHGGCGFFHASTNFARWTLHMLMEHGDVLKSARIYDTVWTFKDHSELANREVMRAIIECFWPVTNTFVTPHDKSNFA